MSHKLKDTDVPYFPDLSVLRIDEFVCSTPPMAAFDKPSFVLYDIAC